MKKENSDSDLYGGGRGVFFLQLGHSRLFADLYDDGFTIPLDDDVQSPVEPEELLQDDQQPPSEPAPKSEPAEGPWLPAKPPTGTDALSLSYSAQVAKQFSVYQQTPSQERQQRPANMGAVPQAGPSAIATHETDRSRQDRPIRPSEMKDEG